MPEQNQSAGHAPASETPREDFDSPEDPQRTLDSLAAMLGWMNTPPRRVFEQEINVMKARLKALPSASETGQASAWQPISSAPPRRKLIVSWLNSNGKRRMTFAAFFGIGELDMDDSVQDEHIDEDGKNTQAGWFEDREAGEPSYWPLNEPLTHWRLLPLAPSEDETNRTER